MRDVGGGFGDRARSAVGPAVGPALAPALSPAPAIDRVVLAETLGMAMARRAGEILDRHRDILTRQFPDRGDPDGDQFAVDDAIFTAVLDAANECLGQFDSRPPADRWCDALLHLLDLARYAAE